MKYPLMAVVLTSVALQGCQPEDEPTFDVTGHWTVTNPDNNFRSNFLIVDDNRFLILEENDANSLQLDFSTGTMNQAVTRAPGRLSSDDAIWCDIDLGADEFVCDDFSLDFSVDSASRITGTAEVFDASVKLNMQANTALNKEVGIDDLVGSWIYLGTATLSIQADGTFTGSDQGGDPISGNFTDSGPNQFKFVVNTDGLEVPGMAYLNEDGKLVVGGYLPLEDDKYFYTFGVFTNQT